MSLDTASGSKATWTWADQISTYRFWGLLAFYTLSSVGASSVLRTYLTFIIWERAASTRMLGWITLALALFGLYGFWLAWSASRWNMKKMLYSFSLAQLAGIALFLVGTTQTSLVWLYFGAFFFGAGTAAILLSVPAIIAGGRGGAEAFLLAFGIVFTVSTLADSLYPFTGNLIDLVSLNLFLVIVVALPIVAGLFFLLPVNRALFNEEAPPRGRSFAPVYRDPVAVAFLMFVPLYNIYHLLHWLYRAHGEVAFLSPSRSLLSPGAAIGAAFIPLLTPVLTTILIDQLNVRLSRQEQQWSAGAVFIWSLLLFPVAMALVQSAINRAPTWRLRNE